MLVSHPKRDYNGKYDYYFVSNLGNLAHFQSEKELKVDSVIYLESFPVGDYLMRVSEVITIEGKTVVKLESVNVSICRQSAPK